MLQTTHDQYQQSAIKDSSIIGARSCRNAHRSLESGCTNGDDGTYQLPNYHYRSERASSPEKKNTQSPSSKPYERHPRLVSPTQKPHKTAQSSRSSKSRRPRLRIPDCDTGSVVSAGEAHRRSASVARETVSGSVSSDVQDMRGSVTNRVVVLARLARGHRRLRRQAKASKTAALKAETVHRRRDGGRSGQSAAVAAGRRVCVRARLERGVLGARRYGVRRRDGKERLGSPAVVAEQACRRCGGGGGWSDEA